MPTVVFTANDLREFQPELAARLEKEVRDGAAEEPEESAMECRILERHAERPQISVQLESKDWIVSFAVTTPAAEGELRMATKRALRNRTRRGPDRRAPGR